MRKLESSWCIFFWIFFVLDLFFCDKVYALARELLVHFFFDLFLFLICFFVIKLMH
jgi:hypothetical protein